LASREIVIVVPMQPQRAANKGLIAWPKRTGPVPTCIGDLVANAMRTFGRNVLSEIRQEIEWRQNLEIPVGTGLNPIPILIGKGLALLLFGFVDNLSRIGYLDQTSQAKRAADHVLNQTLVPTGRPRSKGLIGRR